MDEIVYRTARGMAAEGHPYTGTLFAGLMIKVGWCMLFCSSVIWQILALRQSQEKKFATVKEDVMCRC